MTDEAFVPGMGLQSARNSQIQQSLEWKCGKFHEWGQECRPGIQLLGTNRAGIVKRPCVILHCMPVTSIFSPSPLFRYIVELLVLRRVCTRERVTGGENVIELQVASQCVATSAKGWLEKATEDYLRNEIMVYWWEINSVPAMMMVRAIMTVLTPLSSVLFLKLRLGKEMQPS